MIKRAPLEAVSIADSALDITGMGHDLGKYLATRDPSLVKELPGMKATRFYLEDIPGSMWWNYVMAAPENSQLRLFRAFQYGVRRIENLERNGRVVDSVSPDMEGNDINRTPYWSEDVMFAFPPSYVVEIGGLAYARGFFAEQTPSSWPVPPSSLEVLAHRMQRLVVEIQSTAGQTNEKPSDEGPPTSAGGSVKPGSAPAKATPGRKRRTRPSKPADE